MAPELCREVEYDNKVDVWSTGVIAYVLLSGQPPFIGQNKDQIYTAICNKEASFKRSVWNAVSEEAKDFIKQTLIKDFSKRPSFKTLLQHPWMKKVESKTISEDKALDIVDSLDSFRKTSALQQGVIGFLANMQATADDLEDLAVAFKKIDKDGDGVLTKDELKDGMNKYFGSQFAGDEDWDEILS